MAMSRSGLWRVSVALVAAMSIVAAGCGGSDDGVTSSSLESGAPDADTSSSDTGTDTDAGTGTDPGTGSADDGDPSVGGDSDSDWCRAVRASMDDEESTNPFDFQLTGFDPAQMEAYFTRNLELIDEWQAKAPPEIAPAVGTMRDYVRSFVDIAEAAEWNMFALADDADFLALADDPAVQRAAAEIDAYTRDVCGVDFTEVGASTPPVAGGDGGDVVIDDAMVQELLATLNLPADTLTAEQATCLGEQLSSAFPDGPPASLDLSPEQSAALGVAMASCGYFGG